MPLGRWLRSGASELADGVGRRGRLGELVDPALAERTAAAHAAGAGTRTGVLHSFLFLEHWLERWA